jgi:hypothetical protein
VLGGFTGLALFGATFFTRPRLSLAPANVFLALAWRQRASSRAVATVTPYRLHSALRVLGSGNGASWLFPCSVDLSSILIAIGSLAGNVSFSASSSSSFRCAIAAGRDFCVFFGVNMTLGAFFAFLVIACLHQQPKGGAHLRVERGPNRAFVNEIAHIKQGRAWPLLGRSGDGETW